MNTNTAQKAPDLSSSQSPLAYRDEISLVDIVNVLIRRKKFILGTTIAVVCIGLIYAFSAKRVYEVETILLPPSFENIQGLNLLIDTNVENNMIIDRKEVFKLFEEKLQSWSFKQEFFNKYKILEALSEQTNQNLNDKDKSEIFKKFSDSIKVKKNKNANSIKTTLEGPDEYKISLWLDSFIVMANQETIDQLIKDLRSKIDSKIQVLNIKIYSRRSTYKQRLEDRLGRLEEAFQIAKALGIHDYNDTSSMKSKNNNLSIYMQEKKIYMQGTRVLQAEINAIKNRKSDDIYIKGLRDLQEHLTRLKSIKIEKEKIQSVIIDKKGSGNIELIQPKRQLIIMLSLILGGMLGIFAVFIMEFISNLKNQTDSVNVA